MSIITSSTTITQTNINGYTWPVTIDGGSSQTPITITFGENITLNSTSQYFGIATENITIEGNQKTITIDNVSGYPGVFFNGSPGAGTNGNSNTIIQNLNIASSNGSILLDSGGGWVCQRYFGNRAKNNIIQNCSSSGDIGNSSSGQGCGGILGNAIASNGNIIIQYCYSTGIIVGESSGGIVGSSAGITNGIVIVQNCYSSGNITGLNAGGIVGARFGHNSNNQCKVLNCYSNGTNNTNTNTGGIVGANVCYNNSSSPIYNPNVLIQNCYSTGITNRTEGRGAICAGTPATVYTSTATLTISNCYSLYEQIVPLPLNSQITLNIGNNYSETSPNTWNDTSASENLTGNPNYKYGSLANPVGTTWIDIEPGNSTTPWLFSTFGLSPYTTTLTDTYTQTIVQTQSTNGTLNPSGHTYSIVAINNELPSVYPTITIETSGTNGGRINTLQETAVGIYNIKVMQNSDYSITNFNLTLNANCYLETTKILCIIDGKEIYKEIKDIKIGDLVKTYLYGNKKVIRKVKVRLQNNVNKSIHKLYKMSKESDDRLIDDLYVSGQHSMLVDKLSEKEKSKSLTMWSKLQKIDDKELLMAWVSDKFEEVKDNKLYTLYQLVLESENKKQQYGIYSNGVLSETMSESTFDRKKNMEKIFF